MGLSLSRMGLRHHFRSDGTAKKSYRQEEAQLLGERIGQVAYQCRVCGRWHLAKKKERG